MVYDKWKGQMNSPSDLSLSMKSDGSNFTKSIYLNFHQTCGNVKTKIYECFKLRHTWNSKNFLAMVYFPPPQIKNAHFGWFDALTSPKYKCLIIPLLFSSFTYKFKDAETLYPRFVKTKLDEKRWWVSTRKMTGFVSI